MTFWDEDEIEDANNTPKNRWRNISKLVLNKNKKAFRRTLIWINSRLYAELGSKIWDSNEEYFDIDDLDAISAIKDPVQKVKIAKKCKLYKKDLLKKNFGSRDSIMSMLIDDYRQCKIENIGLITKNQNHAWIEKLEGSPSLQNKLYIEPHLFTPTSKSKLNKSWRSSELLSIPEVRGDEFWDRSNSKVVPPKMKIDAAYHKLDYQSPEFRTNNKYFKEYDRILEKKDLLSQLIFQNGQISEQKWVQVKNLIPKHFSNNSGNIEHDDSINPTYCKFLAMTTHMKRHKIL